MEEDYKIGDWHFEWSELAPKDLVASLKTVAVHPVATAYLENVERFLALSFFPTSLFLSGIKFERAEVAARMTVLGRPFSEHSHSQMPDELAQEFEVAKLRNAYFLGIIPFPDKITLPLTSSGRAFEATSPYFRRVFQTLMATQIVGMWTTFETLATDLWETCLNARPTLGFTALGAEPLPGDDEEEHERKRKTKLTLPIWLIEQWDFNLKDRMGTLLQSINKWDFARRDHALDAYVKAFGKESKPQLEAVFRNQQLQWLAALRNAIVHSSGLADAEFVRLTQSHHTLSKIAKGESILLNGLLCKELVTAGCECCKQLLHFVDEWMAANA